MTKYYANIEDDQEMVSGYTSWLRAISYEDGANPLSERDAEHLARVAKGIDSLAVKNAHLNNVFASCFKKAAIGNEPRQQARNQAFKLVSDLLNISQRGEVDTLSSEDANTIGHAAIIIDLLISDNDHLKTSISVIESDPLYSISSFIKYALVRMATMTRNFFHV